MIPKFRAYINSVNKIVDVTEIDLKNKMVTLDIATNKVNPEWSFWWKETELSFGDVELMQSTGFVDDNNIEIFEGDIVNYGYFTNGDLLGKLEEYEEKGIIEFLKGAFYIKFLYDRCLLSDVFGSSTHIEIIGNIYENKELLED